MMMLIVFILGFIAGCLYHKYEPKMMGKKPKPHFLKDTDYDRDWV